MCPYCNPSVNVAAGGGKGRTVIESPASSGAPAGGFVKGATLLEGAPMGKGGTKVETGPGSGRVAYGAPGAIKTPKGRTVFDPGPGAAPGGAPAAQAISKLVGWLVTFSNLPTGEDYRIREGRNTIGMDSNECDVLLGNDSAVSSKHAVIMYRDGVFQVRDNDSTNGTYVNGSDIFGKGAVVLNKGDKVRVGGTELTLHVVDV